MELTSDIRKRLQELMKERGETGYSLNRKLGISATTISNYLNGKIRKADNTKIQAICTFLGKDIHWLETGTDMNMAEASNPITVENTDELLKQILMRLTGKEEQFSILRKDLHHLQTNLDSLKKEVVHLKEQILTTPKN